MGHGISTLSRKSVPCGRHPVSNSDWKHFKPEFCCCEGLMYADRFLASRCGLEEGRDLGLLVLPPVVLEARLGERVSWDYPLPGPAPPRPRPTQAPPLPAAAAGRGRAAPGEPCRRGWGSSRSRSLFSAAAGWIVSIKVFFFFLSRSLRGTGGGVKPQPPPSERKRRARRRTRAAAALSLAPRVAPFRSGLHDRGLLGRPCDSTAREPC